MSSQFSTGALIGDTVKWNWQSTQIKSNAGFWGEGKPEYPKRANKLNPHMMHPESRNRTPTTLVRGKCSHHCAIPVKWTRHRITWLSLRMSRILNPRECPKVLLKICSYRDMHAMGLFRISYRTTSETEWFETLLYMFPSLKRSFCLQELHVIGVHELK